VITICKIIVWVSNTKEFCYFIWGNVTINFVHKGEQFLFILI